MTSPVPYDDLVREMRDAYNHRRRLVDWARPRGLKPTARLFVTTAPTVRKWLRRYQQLGPSGLLEPSRAPHRQPGKTPPQVEQQVVELRQQDLAAVKATGRLFQQISADTKDLDDIPHFWPQAQALGLPLVQYTARDVRSGLLFLAFAQRRSAAASEVFAARIQRHLDRWGVSLRDLVWQTDNGGEFVGRYNPSGPRTGFPSALGDSQHVRIPPAAHTY